MKKFPIALQLYSVRGDMSADFEGTLRKVKEMGYDGVEFAGLFGRDPVEVNSLCKEIGLVPISAHVGYDDMMKDPDLIKTYKIVGCRFVVIPALVGDYCVGHARHDEVVAGIKKLGALARDLGMKLCYHNHDFEFAKIDGEYALDILYKECPPEVLQTQLDLCWVNVGGENPAEYLRKYKGRAEIVHFKDFVGRKSENMYGLLGVDEDEKKDTQGKFELRPVGYGLQKFPEILKAAEDAGSEWVIIEQDSPSMDKTALECAQMSIEYLRSIMK